MPICYSDSEALLGCELLTRGPVGSRFRFPDVYMHEAQRRGVLEGMDRQCIECCLRAASEMPGNLNLFINVYSGTVLAEGFIDWFHERLQRRRTPRHNLVIEIHESSSIDDIEQLIQRMEDIRAIGLSVAFDDLQPGGMTPTHWRLAPDFIKIDRGVMMFLPRPQAHEYLDHMMMRCRRTDAHLLVEGVESREDLDFVRGIGVELAQGYYFGKPTPVSQWMRRL